MRRMSVLLMAVLCVSCTSDRKMSEVNPEHDLPCDRSRDPDTLHCTVSIYSLIAFPEKYEQTIVSVKGYVSDGRYLVLFANRESAEHSILENGIRLQVEPKHMPRLAQAARIGRYIRLSGEFLPMKQDQHALDKGSVYVTAGMLTVRAVSAEDEDAWGCSVVDERPLKDRFMRADPCRNLDLRKELEQKRESDKPAPAM